MALTNNIRYSYQVAPAALNRPPKNASSAAVAAVAATTSREALPMMHTSSFVHATTHSQHHISSLGYIAESSTNKMTKGPPPPPSLHTPQQYDNHFPSLLGENPAGETECTNPPAKPLSNDNPSDNLNVTDLQDKDQRKKKIRSNCQESDQSAQHVSKIPVSASRSIPRRNLQQQLGPQQPSLGQPQYSGSSPISSTSSSSSCQHWNQPARLVLASPDHSNLYYPVNPQYSRIQKQPAYSVDHTYSQIDSKQHVAASPIHIKNQPIIMSNQSHGRTNHPVHYPVSVRHNVNDQVTSSCYVCQQPQHSQKNCPMIQTAYTNDMADCENVPYCTHGDLSQSFVSHGQSMVYLAPAMISYVQPPQDDDVVFHAAPGRMEHQVVEKFSANDKLTPSQTIDAPGLKEPKNSVNNSSNDTADGTQENALTVECTGLIDQSINEALKKEHFYEHSENIHEEEDEAEDEEEEEEDMDEQSSDICQLENLPSSALLRIRMMIMNSKAGTIIGRHGCVINALRQDSNCKVTMSADSTNRDRILTIAGHPSSVYKVLDQVCSLLKAANISARKAAKNEVSPKFSTSPASSSSISIVLAVPSLACGCLIGRQGLQIQQFRHKFRVLFTVSQTPVSNEIKERPVSITGNSVDVSLCLREVCHRLAQYPTKSSNSTIQNEEFKSQDSLQDDIKSENKASSCPEKSISSRQTVKIASFISNGSNVNEVCSNQDTQSFSSNWTRNMYNAQTENHDEESREDAGAQPDIAQNERSLDQNQNVRTKPLVYWHTRNPAINKGQRKNAGGGSAGQSHTIGSHNNFNKHTEENLGGTPIRERTFELSNGENEVHLLVPNDIVGCIIGRGGKTISGIRKASGAHISITDGIFPPSPPDAIHPTSFLPSIQQKLSTPAKGMRRDRVILIRGNSVSVRHARFLMGSSILNAQRGSLPFSPVASANL